MNTLPIRLLVVDDHPILRAGLRTIQDFDADIKIVGEAANAEQAIALAATTLPHLVLLDIRLEGQSGIEVCRILKMRQPELRVLFLTSYADEQLILSALEAGADGYLLKENDTSRLVAGIREVMRGESVFDPRVTRQLATRSSEPGVHAASLLGGLTQQERRVLAEIAQGKTDKEVAAALGLTSKTARNYLDRIFTKLNVHTRTEAALLYTRFNEKSRPWG